jgi:hypothetical protein
VNLKIERCGRKFAAKLLEDRGYSVEQMPQENPGFDISATKEGKELRVEVKAHLQEASSVNITRTEVKESVRCNQGKDKHKVRWQLWSIENLSEDAPAPILRRYGTVVDDALTPIEFVLDLTKCIPISTELE